MGNDGGSIPGRKDLVREKPKEIKIDNEIVAKARFVYFKRSILYYYINFFLFKKKEQNYVL